MPVVFRDGGFRFHFFSREGNPREPIHIHITAPGADCKLWLYPQVRKAYNRGIDEHTLRRLIRIVELRRTEIEDAWHDHFGRNA